MRFQIFSTVAVLGLALAPSSHAATLYAISGDAVGVPRQISSFTEAGSATSLFELGDGSVGFAGGLAYSSTDAVFYTIGSDGQGASSLYSFDLTGTLTSQFSLGDGFFGGLAWNANDGYLYAVQNDVDGFSSIYRLDTAGHTSTYLFTVGQGLTGGLTYSTGNGDLYGIVNDPLGNSTLMQITVATGASTTVGPPLGAGFLGGVAFDVATGGFHAINMNGAGASTLNAIAIASPGSVTPGVLLGEGYAGAGLSYGPSAEAPEPATWLLTGLGLIGVALSRRRLA